MKKTTITLFLLVTLAHAAPLLRGFNLSMYSPDTGELTHEDFQQMKDIDLLLYISQPDQQDPQEYVLRQL